MKKHLINFLIIFLLSLISNFCVGQKKHFAYSVSIENETGVKIDSTEINNALSVITKRLLQLSHNKTSVIYEKNKQQIIITSIENLDSLNLLKPLLKPCKINFYECHSIDGFIAMLESNKTKRGISLKDSFLFVVNDLSNHFNDTNAKPYLTNIKLKNVEKYYTIIKPLEKFYNDSFLFAYQKKNEETDGHFVALYALKNNKNTIEVNAVLDSVNTNFNEMGRAVLNIY